jgi:hypothetical protein
MSISNEVVTSSALKIIDNHGNHIFTIPEPVFFDNDSPSYGASMIQGKYLVKQENDYWLLSTLVPVDWLKDKNRNYPVIIDPTVVLAGATGGWMSTVTFVNNPGFVFIGVCCGNAQHRAWVKFNTSSIPDNSCVTNVELEIFVNGVGASTPELVHVNDITGAPGPYTAVNTAVLTDMGNGWYTSFTITGTGTYGYYDLGVNADALLQSQLPLDWFQPALIFDNEPSTAWKRLTATACNLRVTYNAPPCTLPVEMLDFNAECEKSYTQLNWTTASEVNNDYFTIEKSKDAINFFNIGVVQGKGNSNVVNTYSFNDTQFNNETVYYRLKQTDFNGKFTFYDIIPSNCRTQSIEIIQSRISNNQLGLTVNNFSNQKDLTITLHGSTGQLLFSKKIALVVGKNELIFNDLNIASGIYFISLFNGKQSTSLKIINH